MLNNQTASHLILTSPVVISGVSNYTARSFEVLTQQLVRSVFRICAKRQSVAAVDTLKLTVMSMAWM